MEIELSDRLQQSEVLVYDGPKGTLLSPHMKKPSDSTVILNIHSSQVVEKAHKAYIEAGAGFLQTNTFDASSAMLELRGLAHRTYELNLKGAQIAVSAANGHAYVAGDIGPTGWILEEEGGNMTMENMIAAFIDQSRGLINGGVDCIHIETMSSLKEVEAAIIAVRSISETIPIIVTMTYQVSPKGEFRTSMGAFPAQLITIADKYSLIAHGANCGIGPDGADILITQLQYNHPNAIIVAKFNAGLPIIIEGVPTYPATPQIMADHAIEMRDLGVKIIGACCGGTPQHIEAMANAIARRNA